MKIVDIADDVSYKERQNIELLRLAREDET